MKSKELEPCPFCGGEAHIDHNHVYCADCGCMPAINDDKKDSLVNHFKLWNTRVNPEQELVPDVDKITAINDGYNKVVSQEIYKTFGHPIGRELDEEEMELFLHVWQNSNILKNEHLTNIMTDKLAKAICAQFTAKEVRLPEKKEYKYCRKIHRRQGLRGNRGKVKYSYCTVFGEKPVEISKEEYDVNFEQSKIDKTDAFMGKLRKEVYFDYYIEDEEKVNIYNQALFDVRKLNNLKEEVE